MNVARLSAPTLITHQGALKQLAETLAREPIIAVDTESNSLHAYREQVCLINRGEGFPGRSAGPG
jgi:ribonuclease D